MGPAQQCKTCRTKFSENSCERNYNNWETYHFNSKEEFQRHSSRNNKCPAKVLNQLEESKEENEIQSEIEIHSGNNETTELQWPEYTKYNTTIDENGYNHEKSNIEYLLQKHNKNKGGDLWHSTSELASSELMEGILDENINFMTLVAEPGSGKTAVSHNLIYKILTLPYEDAINPKNITILTGMSDIEWYNQLLDNYTLKDGKYLWDEINRIQTNHCISHRSNFHKRITYVLDNLELIHSHVFIIDEFHFADSKEMTIDNELIRLGLTLERMKQYNITIINISASPDVNLSIFERCPYHTLVKLEKGPNYKGFKYFNDKNMIIDYDSSINLELKIRHYTTPRYHYIRARTSTEKGKFQAYIKELTSKNNWLLIEDDSSKNYYISFKNDNNEKMAESLKKSIVRPYIEPPEHTIILIKDKYSASKRLKLTQFTGVIVEKPAQKRDTTTTSQGLIPRFWMYGNEPEYTNNEPPLFICDYGSVKEYIKFSETFKLNGIDYTSKRLHCTKNKIREKKGTCYSALAGEEPITQDSDIVIKPFPNINEISNYLRMNGIPNQDISINSFHQKNGYYYPKRNVPGHNYHNETDPYMTEETYKPFKNNGGGSFVNRSEQGQGQRFMIYPVYKEMDSNELIWYLHYKK
jgi:hypothetical protein